LKIIEATTLEHIEVARTLFREYQEFLNVDLCFQGFEEELASLPGKYASPKGVILLAEVDGDIAGCVAVREIKDGICEMKRLYVKEQFRGLSIGQSLAVEIIKQAKNFNYQKMQLDTLQRLETAMGIYQKLGFKKISPYYANPLDEVVYWELDLAAN
jgi:putative acetyltransferase